MQVPPFDPVPAGECKWYDFCSSQGAQTLARKIEAAWRRAGHNDVRCTVHPMRGRDGAVLGFDVRSNLVGGLPPAMARRMAA